MFRVKQLRHSQTPGVRKDMSVLLQRTILEWSSTIVCTIVLTLQLKEWSKKNNNKGENQRRREAAMEVQLQESNGISSFTRTNTNTKRH
jgi:hypothetical protein